jgi:predicted secreted hydrolase
MLTSGPRIAVLVLAGLLGCNADEQPVQPDGGRPDVGNADGDGGAPGISLPADESPHSAPMEWWYYTGRLTTAAGAIYGFELTIFQTILADKPLYVGHFAITDVAGKAFHSKMDASAVDQRQAAQQGFALKVGTMEMSGHAGVDAIKATVQDHGIDLSLTAKKPAVLQYGDGVMTVGSDEPFYYYSYTRMEATGTVTIDGTPSNVTGLAWMDHQWGTIGTDYGWDWFSLRLDDLTEVMLFLVRRSGKPGFVGGTYIDSAGVATPLAASDFSTTATGQWTSPHTQITYPQGWQIVLPALGLQLDVAPALEDQEFNHSMLGSPIYWEGLCDVAGTRAGNPVAGHAYVELTGNFQ